jgi:hypothetical protein
MKIPDTDLPQGKPISTPYLVVINCFTSHPSCLQIAFVLPASPRPSGDAKLTQRVAVRTLVNAALIPPQATDNRGLLQQ